MSDAPDTPPDLPPPDAAAADTAPDRPPDVPLPPLAEACTPSSIGVDELPLAEGSGAALIDDGAALLVAADSGNLGQAVLLQLGAAAPTALTLPLDAGANDDLEGLSATPDGRVAGITSAGFVREWTLTGASASQDRSAYPIAAAGSDWVCDPDVVNCGPNYEGLCLHPAPAPADPCVGFAASKARGVLICLVTDGEELRADPSHTVPVVAEPDLLSGCAFEATPPHRLVVAGNLFSASTVWEVEAYQDPAAAAVVELPFVGAPNQEAVVFTHDGVLLSFGDLQDLRDVTPIAAFSCR